MIKRFEVLGSGLYSDGDLFVCPALLVYLHEYLGIIGPADLRKHVDDTIGRESFGFGVLVEC